MGGVQQHVDALFADVLRQTFCAAITTHPHFAAQIARHPAHPGQAVDMLRAQGTGDGQRFGDAAQ